LLTVPHRLTPVGTCGDAPCVLNGLCLNIQSTWFHVWHEPTPAKSVRLLGAAGWRAGEFTACMGETSVSSVSHPPARPPAARRRRACPPAARGRYAPSRRPGRAAKPWRRGGCGWVAAPAVRSARSRRPGSRRGTPAAVYWVVVHARPQARRPNTRVTLARQSWARGGCVELKLPPELAEAEQPQQPPQPQKCRAPTAHAPAGSTSGAPPQRPNTRVTLADHLHLIAGRHHQHPATIARTRCRTLRRLRAHCRRRRRHHTSPAAWQRLRLVQRLRRGD
jgi:hypothetical protein